MRLTKDITRLEYKLKCMDLTESASFVKDLKGAYIFNLLIKLYNLSEDGYSFINSGGYRDYNIIKLKGSRWFVNKTTGWYYDTGLGAIEFHTALKNISEYGYISYYRFYNENHTPSYRIKINDEVLELLYIKENNKENNNEEIG